MSMRKKCTAHPRLRLRMTMGVHMAMRMPMVARDTLTPHKHVTRHVAY